MPLLEARINGEEVRIEIDGLLMLVDLLRDHLGLTGTKIGCREGECGACTVLLDGHAVNSCLLPAMKAHGSNIITVEGIGTIENPHPIQKHIAEVGGVQCGYCTPGFVMSGFALLQANPDPSREDVMEAIEGNLCRCTGYLRIIRGIQQAGVDLRSDRKS
jgi:carbon-monoxide dehydrogenase small subunit